MGAPPPTISQLTNIARLPDDGQRTMIERYARYYAEKLGSADATEVQAGRSSLGQPLRSLQITRFFRDAYSDALLPALDPVIRGGKTALGPINAMQLVAQLSTEQALDVLKENCSEQQQDRMAVRLWAARGFSTAIAQGRADGLIPDHRLPSAIRELGAAARVESDWRVLQWQFDSLGRIDHPVAREEQRQVFGAVLDRMAASDTATALVNALGLHNDERSRPQGPLLSLRKVFLDATPTEQATIGVEMGKRLVRLLEIAEKHWDSAHAQGRLRAAYHRAVRIAESQFATIHFTLSNGNVSTSLDEAWQASDRDAYKADLDRLRDLISRAPYS
jgi:hypothetical protein